MMSKPYSQPGENPTDTNQASELFELCKEVYERTGWLVNDRSPEYTSDYLLERLPRTVKDVMYEDAHLMLYPKGKVWKADYIGMFMEAKGDTPLKALLKLTIALSEAGELE